LSGNRKTSAIFTPFNTNGAARGVVPVIAPSMLSSDFAHADRELARCKRANAKWIHVDVMDGHFVPNITMGPPLLRKWVAAQPDLFYDTHLMIEKPMSYAEAFAAAGSNLITIHIETTTRPRRDLRSIRRLGVRTGLTIKPRTSIKGILPYLDEVDLVLVMTVEPGFGGQKIIPSTLNKVRELDLFRRREKLSYRLQVDGGINVETAPLALAAGADVLVAGHAVFNKGGISANLRTIRDRLKQKTG
jgi:ribulose-phosphate 3-epimerase